MAGSDERRAVILYGIPGCDSVRKARRWLDEHGIGYTFHDYRKAGIEADRLARWVDAVGWEPLLNRRGTTFRQLDEADKESLDTDTAQALMRERTSLIKRPVVEHGDEVLVGFVEMTWKQLLIE